MKAVIARSDLLTAYGRGIKPLWAGLIDNQTAITGSPVFAGSQPVPHKLAMIPDLQLTDQISRARAMLDQLLSPLSGRLDPQTPMILATTVGEIEFIQRAVLQSDPSLADLADPQLLLKHIQQLLGLRGPAMVLSSACASSAAALSQAASVVRRGQSPAVLVITCDAISELVYSGFTTLLSLCETPARPFDAGRCGLSLGEAAAWALVTTEDSKLADAQSPAILGWASTTDAVHMTAPDRNAGGLSRAISAACAMARVQAKQIGLIAAHGTATLYNDAMELTAFRNSLPAPVPVFSIKGGTGHALAAAGLVQILVAAHALQQRVVPPTVGLLEPDESAVGWARNKPVPLTDESIALSTNSGFGGVNTSVLLGLGAASIPTELAKSVSMLGRSWFSSDRCGFTTAAGKTDEQAAPSISDSKQMTALIGRNLKYFPRMTTEIRQLLAAASLAIQAVGWSEVGDRHIGILGCGYGGVLNADLEYFRDYVAQGRTIGRGNLFIYTLPTSALSEVAIALGLTGPTLHLHEATDAPQALVKHATRLIENGEADGMVCVWHEGATARCVAIGI